MRTLYHLAAPCLPWPKKQLVHLSCSECYFDGTTSNWKPDNVSVKRDTGFFSCIRNSSICKYIRYILKAKVYFEVKHNTMCLLTWFESFPLLFVSLQIIWPHFISANAACFLSTSHLPQQRLSFTSQSYKYIYWMQWLISEQEEWFTVWNLWGTICFENPPALVYSGGFYLKEDLIKPLR